MAETVGIVGVGLIGGSVAAAARSRGGAERLIGFGRDRVRLEAAVAAGLIDEGRTAFDGSADLDLAVVCTPVGRIADDVRAVARSCRPGAVVTDAGSVKASVVAKLRVDPPAGVTFVGAHPLAGSERSGFEHADAALFSGRRCVVTPEGAGRSAVATVTRFWESLGCVVSEMSAGDHDRTVAMTSHLPHLVASVLAAAVVDRSDLAFASTGFGDTTRIAAGDPGLWVEIVRANRGAVVEALSAFGQDFTALLESLTTGSGDLDGLRSALEAGRAARDAFETPTRDR